MAMPRHQGVHEGVDYLSSRSLDRRLFEMLLKGNWVAAHENCAIIGPASVGKSCLAPSVISPAVTIAWFSTRLPRLIDDLSLAKGHGRIAARTKSLVDSTCLSWMTGSSNRSMAMPATICSRSSKIVTAGAGQRLSSDRRTAGWRGSQ